MAGIDDPLVQTMLIDRIRGQQERELLEALFSRPYEPKVPTDFERLLDQPVKTQPTSTVLASRGASIFPRIGMFLKGTGILGEAIGFELEIIKLLREIEDEESRQQAEWEALRLKRHVQRRAKDAFLRTTVQQRPDQGSDLPPEHPDRPTRPEALPVPESRPPAQPAPTPDPIRVPGSGPGLPEFPDPVIAKPERPEPVPPAPQPTRRPGAVVPVPSPIPIPTSSPGPIVAPVGAPAPVFQPATFRNPYLEPKPRKLKIPRKILTDVQDVLLQSPKVAPSPQTKFAPGGTEPPRRDRERRRCYKGLYKETRSGIDKKTRWARIDCDTGEELGIKARLFGIRRRVKPKLKAKIGAVNITAGI